MLSGLVKCTENALSEMLIFCLFAVIFCFYTLFVRKVPFALSIAA